MSTTELKLLIYLALTASGVLITVILFGNAPMPINLGAALCLWGCGLLNGMSWQLMIDNRTQPQKRTE